jgi:hypothetical protein
LNACHTACLPSTPRRRALVPDSSHGVGACMCGDTRNRSDGFDGSCGANAVTGAQLDTTVPISERGTRCGVLVDAETTRALPSGSGWYGLKVHLDRGIRPCFVDRR